MKLFRYGKLGQEKPGVVANGKYYDASTHFSDYDEDFFAQNGLEKLEQLIKNKQQNALKEISEADLKKNRFGSAVARPSKIICIGLNFKDHAKEGGMEPPKEPVVFFKATSSLIGPNDDVVIPQNSRKPIGRWNLLLSSKNDALTSKKNESLDYVAGYALHNDYSERTFQLERSGQWVKGKSADTFAPLGPYLVTPDEIKNINQLNMWLKVNGEVKQNGNTKNFIFDIPTIIAHLSEFMSLLPGDVISTGTPAGVGMGTNTYLKHGDVVELGIDELGTSKQNLKDYRKP